MQFIFWLIACVIAGYIAIKSIIDDMDTHQYIGHNVHPLNTPLLYKEGQRKVNHHFLYASICLPVDNAGHHIFYPLHLLEYVLTDHCTWPIW